MERRKFVTWSNNGVAALVTEEVYQKMMVRVATLNQLERGGMYEDASRLPIVRPIFTFSDYPHLRGWVTGSMADREEFLKWAIVESKIIYVPFSNGRESGLRGKEAQEDEVQYRTTLREAIEAFGLVVAGR